MMPASKKRLLARLRQTGDLMKGSLALTFRSCGKPGCRCQKGEKHRGYFFSYQVRGKANVTYIPESLYQEVKRLVGNWKKLKNTVESLTMMNVKLVQRRRLSTRR